MDVSLRKGVAETRVQTSQLAARDAVDDVLVSAMLVATTILVTPFGGASNTRCWFDVGSDECSGKIQKSAGLRPCSAMVCVKPSTMSLISPNPGANTKMPAGGRFSMMYL